MDLREVPGGAATHRPAVAVAAAVLGVKALPASRSSVGMEREPLQPQLEALVDVVSSRRQMALSVASFR